MQEFYFSGTIERVIFENASNFFRILLLEIDETDSDFETMKSLSQEPWEMSWKVKIILSGVS